MHVEDGTYMFMHVYLFSAEAANEWRYSSTPTLCLHGVNRYLMFVGPCIIVVTEE